jgi:hypothetical protein
VPGDCISASPQPRLLLLFRPGRPATGTVNLAARASRPDPQWVASANDQTLPRHRIEAAVDMAGDTGNGGLNSPWSTCREEGSAWMTDDSPVSP